MTRHGMALYKLYEYYTRAGPRTNAADPYAHEHQVGTGQPHSSPSSLRHSRHDHAVHSLTSLRMGSNYSLESAHPVVLGF